MRISNPTSAGDRSAGFDHDWFIPFGSIRLQGVIGKGAMGQVLKATVDEVPVAAKRMQIMDGIMEDIRREAMVVVRNPMHASEERRREEQHAAGPQDARDFPHRRTRSLSRKKNEYVSKVESKGVGWKMMLLHSHACTHARTSKCSKICEARMRP